MQRQTTVFLCALFLASFVVSAQESEATRLLKARSAEFDEAIIEVTEGVYTAVGYSVSTCTMIEGDDGVIIVDTTIDVAGAERIFAEFRKITNKPIVAIIFTHAHGDHIGGASVFAKDDPVVWARSNFGSEGHPIADAGLTIQKVRGARQAGFKLPPEMRINNGVAQVYYPKRGGAAFHDSDGEGVEFEVTSIVEHSLDLIPVAHVANSIQRTQPVGDSDIAPLVPMLDAVNQMMSDAYWQCYNDQSILKAINIAPPDSEDLEESVIRLGGDQIHFLTQNDQLKQEIERMKPVGIPESFFKTVELLVGQIYKTAGESHLEPLKWTGTNISGVALRLLYEPLAKKTYRKRIYWASGFEHLARIVFAYANAKSVVLSESGGFVLGGPEYQLDDVEVLWGSLMPGDEVEEQKIVLDDLSAGLIGVDEARRKRGV